MIIAIDGVDKVGKSTVAKEFYKFGYKVISADIFRINGEVPLGMRQWADIPILALLRIFNGNAILDRSIISVLAYNIEATHKGNSKDIFDALLPYVRWHKNSIKFIYNDYKDINTILERSDEHTLEEIEIDNDCFARVYEICGIAPLKIYAENSVEEKVKTILRNIKI